MDFGKGIFQNVLQIRKTVESIVSGTVVNAEINVDTDHLEELTAGTNTLLGTTNGELTTIKEKSTSTDTAVGTINTNVGTVNSNVGTINSNVSSVNNKVSSIKDTLSIMSSFVSGLYNFGGTTRDLHNIGRDSVVDKNAVYNYKKELLAAILGKNIDSVTNVDMLNYEAYFTEAAQGHITIGGETHDVEDILARQCGDFLLGIYTRTDVIKDLKTSIALVNTNVGTTNNKLDSLITLVTDIKNILNRVYPES